MTNKSSKIFVAGHNGMVGSAICKLLKTRGYNNIISKPRSDLDLLDQKRVDLFFKIEKPEIVIDSAAVVGGILANNNNPYRFLYENLQIQNNLINSSLNYGVNKFIFLGSSCVYPKMSTQPITEDALLTGQLEETNQWYAIAKISGIKLIESIRIKHKMDYVSLMPTNLYGPNDNFDLETSHVIPGIMRKIHDAKVLNKIPVIWGSGNIFREFMHVDDLANAILLFMQLNHYEFSLYNIGNGLELKVKELVEILKDIIGYKGEVIWDKSKPDGTPRKLLDSSRANDLGWKANIDIQTGIKETYNYFLKKY